MSNKLTALVLLLSLFVFFAAHLFILSPRQAELRLLNEKLAVFVSSCKVAKNDLKQKQEKLSTQNFGKDISLLKAGEEAKLLRQIIKNSSADLEINSFEIHPVFIFEPEIETLNYEDEVSYDLSQELPELDERTGMPLNARTDVDANDSKGTEIIPVSFSFSGSFRHFGSFIKKIETKMPYNLIRYLDLNNSRKGTVDGTILLFFLLSNDSKQINNIGD